MYREDEGGDYQPGLKDRLAAAATAPPVLWQVAAIAAVLALVIVLTGAAVSGRVARLDGRVETLATTAAELDKRMQKLDTKLEAVRTAISALPSPQQPKATPTPTQTQTQPQTQQQQTPAPGQIVPKRKPQ